MSRHAMPEQAPHYPPGIVYVGYATGHVYRVEENDAEHARTTVLLRRPHGWTPPEAKHRPGYPRFSVDMTLLEISDRELAHDRHGCPSCPPGGRCSGR
ncbi:hypothetical protein I5G58_gp091 [Mycobacterium phage BirdsNest]|uniref:Uncharacterized protein n=1 Tax=Mycobacterium phage BirdsNest TaxID=2686231 RepID=A0A6B9L9F0_9CAUD|nr:hypothetical protein I5G58_gp091 [Mycobacterium phage BirdsNest]QHB37393.1 hypothetical protein PBI_BIRDSNEST_91 [Mycobacterium phage BirdsNest]